MLRRISDDALVGVAFAGIAWLCLWFRFLSMVDLPQHYAMVSIPVHHQEPAFGVSQRFFFDFLHRPYATVYWLGALLAHVAPLGVSMRIVVALCTVAPLAVVGESDAGCGVASSTTPASDADGAWFLLAAIALMLRKRA